jgi:hypothetical protein
MPVAVYTFRGDCTVSTASTRFVALNDTTFVVQVEQTSGTPGVGCPGGILADHFVLANPPSRRFRVLFVGADTVEATVNSGTQPSPGVREQFEFRGLSPAHFDSLTVTLIGCDITDTGYPFCQDTLGVIPADQTGIAVFEGSCELDGTPYRAVDPYWALGIELEGTFRCNVPWQTIIQFPN